MNEVLFLVWITILLEMCLWFWVINRLLVTQIKLTVNELPGIS